MTKTNVVLAAAAAVLAAGCLVLFKDNGGQRTTVRALEAQVAKSGERFSAKSDFARGPST